MLLAASRHEVDFTLHREVVDILVERSGINVAAERVSVVLVPEGSLVPCGEEVISSGF